LKLDCIKIDFDVSWLQARVWCDEVG